MSTDVLGRVIEVVSGVTLDQFIGDRIIKPLYFLTQVSMSNLIKWIALPNHRLIRRPANAHQSRM